MKMTMTAETARSAEVTKVVVHQGFDIVLREPREKRIRRHNENR